MHAHANETESKWANQRECCERERQEERARAHVLEDAQISPAPVPRVWCLQTYLIQGKKNPVCDLTDQIVLAPESYVESKKAYLI